MACARATPPGAEKTRAPEAPQPPSDPRRRLLRAKDASILVIAALFQPLTARIQFFIDRRFYGRKYHARKTLEDFSAKVRNETDLEALNNDLVGVVRETMAPQHVSLLLRPNTASRDKGSGEST